MTIKEKLISEIEKLEKIKQELLRKEVFLDPNNDTKIYSTERITDVDGYTGITPNGLRHIFGQLVSAINSHIKLLKSMPAVVQENEFVNSVENTKTIIEVGSQNVAPVGSTLYAQNVPTVGLSGHLKDSFIINNIEKIRFTSMARINRNDINGTPIDFEITIRKINIRKASVVLFKSASGIMDVSFSGHDIDPDDIFLIGVELGSPIDVLDTYYSDFSYRIEQVSMSGEVTESNLVIANSRIGTGTLKADPTYASNLSMRFSTILWDIVTLDTNRFDVRSSDNAPLRQVVDSSPTLLSAQDNQFLASISDLGTSMEFEEGLYSAKADCSYSRVIGSRNYNIYENQNTNQSRINVPNAKPIDVVLEEILNDI